MKQLIFITTLFIVACSPSRQSTVPVNTFTPNYTVGGKMFSSVFQQKAAEYRALCLQAYNIAALRINEFTPGTTKPKAIITDIDETILDNSPYAVHQAIQGKDYDTESWYDWTSRSAADTMPGAATLLQFAASKGIQIFYITNRDERERTGTLKNLQRFGLPNADNDHLLLRQTTSSKEVRRQFVMKSYEVVLLMGDNLADFSSLFDKKTMEERKSNTDISVADFGKKFIVFPNANYGDWEGALIQYNYKLTAAQKDSVYRATLKTY